MNHKALLLSLGFVVLAWYQTTYAQTQNALVAHEWSTITTMHLPSGQAEVGLNVKGVEGSLPSFVHRFDSHLYRAFSKGGMAITPPAPLSPPLPTVSSGLAFNPGASVGAATTPANPPTPVAHPTSIGPPVLPHPDVNMRLETSVVYFYPTKAWNPQSQLDIEVNLPSGILNEFYPDGEPSSNDIFPDRNGLLRLLDQSASKLFWRNIQIGGNWPGPDTKDPIWLAMRAVRSANLFGLKGESEKYLLYGGVMRNSALLTTKHDVTTKAITVINSAVVNNNPLTIPAVWLVLVKGDGTATYRALGSFKPGQKLTIPEPFSEESYTTDKIPVLRRSMRFELMKLGLYQDEADAMLTAWDKPYFENKGTRILYLVPREWIDYYLPIRFSVQIEMARVMVGRIELIGR